MAMTARANDPKALAANLLPIIRLAGEDVRYTMQERLDHYGCPGVSVAVIEDGRLAWSEGYGVIEAGTQTAVGADTMCSGASISKPVSAVLALQMVDKGRFDLDADVNRYLQTWRVPTNEFTRQAPAT